MNDTSYNVGDIFEVTSPKNDIGTAVGSKGVAYKIAGENVYAYWTAADGRTSNGYIHITFLKRINLNIQVGGRFQAVLETFRDNLVAAGFRVPTISQDKIDQLGETWKGQTQGLEEMMSWLNQDEGAQAVLASFGVAWKVKPKKKETVDA